MKIEIEQTGKFQSFIVTGRKEYELLWEFINGSMMGIHLIDDFLEQHAQAENECEFDWGGNSGDIYVHDRSVKVIPTYNEELSVEIPLNQFIGYLHQLKSFLEKQDKN